MTHVKRLAATLACVAALGSVSCGDGSERPDGAVASASQEALDDALGSIEALETRADQLEAEIDHLAADKESASKRLDVISDRLWQSLGKLRTSIRELGEESSAAADSAASALATAQQAAKDLAVLESRFEYHLSHGSR